MIVAFAVITTFVLGSIYNNQPISEYFNDSLLSIIVYFMYTVFNMIWIGFIPLIIVIFVKKRWWFNVYMILTILSGLFWIGSAVITKLYGPSYLSL